MARNEILIDATPDEVFSVLADARYYGYWVVGSSEIRDADDNWPQVGTRFHHKVGVGPLKVADHTVVEEVHRPHLLKLRAKARPLGTAMVTMEMHPDARGTRVVMIEDAADRLTALVFNPLTHLLVRGRNVESLRRLKEIAEGDGPTPEEAAAA